MQETLAKGESRTRKGAARGKGNPAPVTLIPVVDEILGQKHKSRHSIDARASTRHLLIASKRLAAARQHFHAP